MSARQDILKQQWADLSDLIDRAIADQSEYEGKEEELQTLNDEKELRETEYQAEFNETIDRPTKPPPPWWF